MKYPLTPDYIRNAPKPIEQLYMDLESFILKDICSRMKYSDSLTSTAIEEIKTLRRRGYDIKAIEEYIRRTLKLSKAQWQSILNQAVADNQQYYSGVLGSDLLLYTVVHSNTMQAEIEAILKQTNGTFENLTQSMGFSVNVNGVRTFMPIAKAYQKVLDNAKTRVWSGTQSYNEAIRDAVGELANSGIQVVTWDNDGKVHVDRADVAARRAVMTGITQLGSQFSEQVRDEVPTEYIEVTAHRGARDKGTGWQNHKAWQGKVYSTRTGDKYPNIYTVCGWGQVDGLEGANCRHLHYPFWDGISERTWTDEQLKNIDPPDFKWKDGKTYNAYDATQKMRSIERQIRREKRRLIAFQANGDKTAYQTAAIRYKRLNEEYAEFAKASNQQMQDDRRNIAGFGPTQGKTALNTARQAIANQQKFDTMVSELKDNGLIPQKAKVSLPKRNIDTNSLSFDSEHINAQRQHNVTIDDAKDWINTSRISINVWGGKFERYISNNGASYVDLTLNEIRTAFGKNEFDENILGILGVLDKYGY